MKIYAISDKAKDLRPIVQDLNMKRGLKEQQLANQASQQEGEDTNEQADDLEAIFEEGYRDEKPKTSKWEKYVEAMISNEEDEEDSAIVTEWNEKTLKKAETKKRRYSENKREEKDISEDENDEVTEDTISYKKQKIVHRQPNVDASSTPKPIIRSKLPQQKTLSTVSSASSKWSRYAASTQNEEDDEDDSVSLL